MDSKNLSLRSIFPSVQPKLSPVLTSSGIKAQTQMMAEQHCGVRGRWGKAGRGCGGEPGEKDRPNHRDERDLMIAAQRRIRKLECQLAAVRLDTEDDEDAESETASATDGDEEVLTRSVPSTRGRPSGLNLEYPSTRIFG